MNAKLKGMHAIMFHRTYLEHLAEYANQSARTVARTDSAHAHLGLFQSNYPAIYAWLQANRPSNGFAASLWTNLHRFGSLTERQRAAVERSLNPPAQEASLAGAGFQKLLACFTRAQSVGLKWPKLRCGSIVFSVASATSRNAGYVYVKADDQYIGKVSPTGAFEPNGCSVQQHAALLNIARDPLAAAIAHGHATGHCAVCARKLSDPVSVERGIGPICADKFGF